MKSVAIIPARMGSSRFPGKPLSKIHNIPMIGHCYLRTKLCKQLDDVVVATCDEEIKEYIESIGGKAVMTSSKHERATDRTAEALLKLEEENNTHYDVIIMMQGDEPMVVPEMIDLSLEAFGNDGNVKIVNLIDSIDTQEEFESPNEVKVVVDKENNALYFSRQPIPTHKKWTDDFMKYKQLGIITFRRDFLLEFNQLPETELERAESVDMLRVLEHGKSIHMVKTPVRTWSVDTPEDIINVEEKMKNDSLMSQYI